MRPLGMGSPQGGLRKLGLMTRGVPGTGVVAAAGPTLADIQAIVNAQTFGGIWLAQGGAYSDAGTTLAADGGTVQQLNDRSSFANHLAQASAGFRPTYQASDGGYPSLIANGFKALRKTFSGMTVSKPYYNIVAWRPITHTNNYQIVTCDSVTADRALLLGRLTSGTYGIFRRQLWRATTPSPTGPKSSRPRSTMGPAPAFRSTTPRPSPETRERMPPRPATHGSTIPPTARAATLR
jgi:hypothetical protein